MMYCSIFIRAEVDHFCFLRLISCGVPLIPSVGNTKLLLIGAGFLLEKLFFSLTRVVNDSFGIQIREIERNLEKK